MRCSKCEFLDKLRIFAPVCVYFALSPDFACGAHVYLEKREYQKTFFFFNPCAVLEPHVFAYFSSCFAEGRENA